MSGKMKTEVPSVGTKIAEWEVVGEPFVKVATYYIKCRCRCGEVMDVHLSNLMRGISKGCKHPRIIKAGDRFGKWTVIEEVARRDTKYVAGQHRFFKCRCDCGDIHEVAAHHFLYRKNPGCAKCAHITHGNMVSSKPTKEYTAWCSMKQRCDNPNTKYYKDYGGRGITYDPRWKDFEVFLKEVGRAPSPDHTLDRKNNDGNYYKENVRWTTRKVQQNNQSQNHIITHKGVSHTLQEWCDFLGISRPTLNYRLKHWPEDKIFEPKHSHYAKKAPPP